MVDNFYIFEFTNRLIEMVIRFTWATIPIITSLFKAGIAGASFVLALLGAYDFAIAAIWQEALEHMKASLYLNELALSGGAIGMLWQACKLYIR